MPKNVVFDAMKVIGKDTLEGKKLNRTSRVEKKCHYNLFGVTSLALKISDYTFHVVNLILYGSNSVCDYAKHTEPWPDTSD